MTLISILVGMATTMKLQLHMNYMDQALKRMGKIASFRSFSYCICLPGVQQKFVGIWVLPSLYTINFNKSEHIGALPTVRWTGLELDGVCGSARKGVHY